MWKRCSCGSSLLARLLTVSEVTDGQTERFCVLYVMNVKRKFEKLDVGDGVFTMSLFVQDE